MVPRWFYVCVDVVFYVCVDVMFYVCVDVVFYVCVDVVFYGMLMWCFMVCYLRRFMEYTWRHK